ncbi:kinase-like protein [Daldinia sp. FL1419]|nr:kinase-like protein [Daldinia sp. FL1419]
MGIPGDFERAQQLIQGADLAHPDGELLMSFLEDSVDNDQAASYLLGVCDSSEDQISGLAIVLSQWKSLIAIFHTGFRAQMDDEKTIKSIRARDNECFLTGTKGSWKDPLVVVEIFPSVSRKISGSLRDIFAAFFSQEHEDYLESYTSALSHQQPLGSNLWLVRSSAADAFSQGFFQVEIRDGIAHIHITFVTMPEYPRIIQQANTSRIIVLHKEATADFTFPDAISLDILSRLAPSIRWTCIAKIVSPTSPSEEISTKPFMSQPYTWFSYMLDACGNCMLATWRILPTSFRIMMYRGLAYIGSRIYEPTNSFKVQRLPFGMYLKTSPNEWHTSLSNEFKTLDLLRRQTDTPVPKPLDIASDDKSTYLITSRLPGKPIGMCMDYLNDEKLRAFTHDLRSCLKVMRDLQRDPTLQNMISNVSGDACYDGRINAAVEYDETRGDFIGPFSREDEFNETLKNPQIPEVIHRNGHKIVFTHGDINLRNVLVDERSGRLSGIVDWETAGWYPDYWEYTKAHYAIKFKWRWLKNVVGRGAFSDFGDFSEDLDIERKLWRYCW